MTYQDSVLAQSPLVYFRFEGNLDNLGSLGSAPVDATAAFGPGISGAGFAGNGVDRYVTVQTTMDYYSDRFWTIESWVKLDANTPNDYNTITRRAGSGYYVLDRVRGTNLSLNPGRYEVFCLSAGGSVSVVSPASVCDGKWHHVAVTCGSSTLYMWVDGAMVSTGTVPNGLLAPTGYQNIGKAEGNAEYFQGALDEVAIYPTQLSTIADHYQTMIDSMYKGFGIRAN